MALNGAEPVDADTVDAFCEAAAPHGFRPGGVFPAFGMAEVSIAGCFPPPMRGLVTDPVDRRVLEAEGYAAPADPEAEGTRLFAKLGRPVPGLEVRITDPADGHVRGDREVGELEIRGTSVTTGYYRDPEATRSFRDGWLRTGDLAYLVDGELVVCGRIKDVIIIGGRNVFPEDIEKAVATIDGVRAGNVMAFGVEGRAGKEQIVVVAETKLSGPRSRRSAPRSTPPCSVRPARLPTTWSWRARGRSPRRRRASSSAASASTATPTAPSTSSPPPDAAGSQDALAARPEVHERQMATASVLVRPGATSTTR